MNFGATQFAGGHFMDRYVSVRNSVHAFYAIKQTHGSKCNSFITLQACRWRTGEGELAFACRFHLRAVHAIVLNRLVKPGYQVFTSLKSSACRLQIVEANLVDSMRALTINQLTKVCLALKEPRRVRLVLSSWHEHRFGYDPLINH